MNLTILLVLLPFWRCETMPPQPKVDVKEVYRKALIVTTAVILRDHRPPHPLDNEIAHRWFDGFIGGLDPRHVYFTAEDIRRFAKHRDDLDDHARRGDLSFAVLVRKTYAKRLHEVTQHAVELLDQQHDFTVDEKYELRPKSFPSDNKALRERWRKRVKYELLVERAAGLARKDAIKKLRARYRRVARDNRYDDDEELYELYITTFARSFGPHGAYLGERTLINFST